MTFQHTTLPAVYPDQVYRRFSTATADEVNHLIRPIVLASLQQLCPSRGLEITDDLIQDVYLRLVRGQGNYRATKAGVSTWIHGACRQTCQDALRSQYRHGRRMASYGEACAVARQCRGGKYLNADRGA